MFFTSYNWSIPTFTASNLIQRPIYDARDVTTNTGKIIRVSGKSVTIFGYDFVLGDGTTGSKAKAVTYPITFASIPVVMVTYAGWKNGSDFNSFADGAGGEMAYVGAPENKLTTGFGIRIRPDTALSSAYRLGVHYVVTGVM